MKAFLMTVLALGVAACGGGDGSSERFQIDNPHDGLWQDAPEVPIRFLLEQSFGGEDELTLFGLLAVVADDEGNVYALDARPSAIVSFDADGNFRWKYDDSGPGPGQLEEVRGMVSDGVDRLYVSSQSGRRVDVFNFDGEYVNSHPMAGTSMPSGQLLGVLGPDRLVVTNQSRKAGGSTVAVLNISQDEWTAESQFDVDHSSEIEVPDGATAGGPPVGIFEGVIAAGNTTTYRLEFYDLAGQLERVVTRAGITMLRPGVVQFGEFYMVSPVNYVLPPVALDGGYRAVFASWPTNIADPDAWFRAPPNQRPDRMTVQTLDLYDAEWRLLYAWTTAPGERSDWPSISPVDAAGKLYGPTKDPQTSFGRYRIEITPPK